MTARCSPATVHARIVFLIGEVFYVSRAMVSRAIWHSAHVLRLLASLSFTSVRAAALFWYVPLIGLGVAANALGIGAFGYKAHLRHLGWKDGRYGLQGLDVCLVWLDG